MNIGLLGFGVVGGGFVDTAAATGRGFTGNDLAALEGEADFVKAQEDQAEDGAGVFLSLES